MALPIEVKKRKETKTDNSTPFRLNGGVWWLSDLFLYTHSLGIEKSRIIKRDVLLCGVWIQEGNIPENVLAVLRKYESSIPNSNSEL